MPQSPDFDVALSFAGEHRPYVASVAAGLRRLGFRVFYDEFERANLLGRDLIAYLQDVYSHRSATVAAFISQEWVTKPWTGHERQTALAHALLNSTEALPYLLPFRFDDTPVPGLQPTVGYEDLRQLKQGERRWRRDPTYKHPAFVVELLVEVLRSRGLGPEQLEDELGEVGVSAVLVWIQDGESRSVTGLVYQHEYEEGVAEILPDEVPDAEGPPVGRYVLLRPDLGLAVNPEQGFPVFLIDTHEAKEKSWAEPLADPDEQVAVANRVRRYVQEAVEQEIQEGAVPIGPAFTQGRDSPWGPVVYGVCVLARPVRARGESG